MHKEICLDSHSEICNKYLMKMNLKKIKSIMKARGMTAGDLARLLGMHRQSVYDLLAGKTGRTFTLAEGLAKALHVREKDLIE